MPQRIGYAAGAFDLFHVGHLNILKHARENCDVLIAGVVSDEMLRQVKGVEPVIPTLERAEIVRSIRFVDDVYVETMPDKIDAWPSKGSSRRSASRSCTSRTRPTPPAPRCAALST
jgi:glycerol-3-phosphate cytidylyltransferase